MSRATSYMGPRASPRQPGPAHLILPIDLLASVQLPSPLDQLFEQRPRKLLEENLTATIDGQQVTLPPVPAALLSEQAVPYPRRLAAALSAWRALLPAVCSPTKAARILSIISEGFDPHVHPETKPFNRPNASSCEKHSSFLDGEIAKLALLGILRAVGREFAQGVHSMSIQEQANGPRMVVDGTPLNLPGVTTHEPTYACEDLQHLASQIKPLDFASVFDIRRLFYHVPLHPRFQPWCCVQWRDQFYTFASLPLGLQQSPSIATLLVRPAVSFLRRAFSTRLSQYVDDACILGESEAEAHRQAQLYASVFARLGFLLHPTKCSAAPSQQFKFLGFELHTATSPPAPPRLAAPHRASPPPPPKFISVTMLPHKRASLVATTKQLATTVKRGLPLPARKTARYIGAVRAATAAFLPASTATVSLQHHVNRIVDEVGWHGELPPSNPSALLGELSAIRASLAGRLWTARPLRTQETADVVVTPDASNQFGWGATLETASLDATLGHQPIAVAQDQWATVDSPLPALPSFLEIARLAAARVELEPHQALFNERTARALEALPLGRVAPSQLWSPRHARLEEQINESHNTLLESLGALFALLAFLDRLAFLRVAVRTDNTATLYSLLKVRSRNPVIARIALLAHFALACVGARLVSVSHVAGVDNTIADEASRRWLTSRAHLEWPMSHDGYRKTLKRLGVLGHPSLEPTLDAFASSSNTKCADFWSATPDPRAAGHDAFAQHWGKRRLFINPPFAMAARVVTKALQDQPQSAVLLLPEWPNSSWYQLLLRSPLVVTSTPVSTDVIESGPHRNIAEPLRNPRWQLRAWLLQSTAPAPTSSRC